MVQKSAPEAANTPSNPEKQNLVAVHQPQQLGNILSMLDTLAVMDRVGEQVGEQRDGDWSGNGTQATRNGGDDRGTASARDLAIANLPSSTEMRTKLVQNIEQEVRTLQKQIHRAARRASKPGNAHQMTMLYARIRRLNSLLTSLKEAAIEIVRRLYIRIIIDKQSVV